MIFWSFGGSFLIGWSEEEEEGDDRDWGFVVGIFWKVMDLRE